MYNDLLIAVSYFSIPLQIVLSLYKYPRLHSMPTKMLVLAVLFTLFIFSCGIGHLLRFLQLQEEVIFACTNAFTMLVSVATALYLVPLVPNLMSMVDQQVMELVRKNEEREAFIAFLFHEIRQPLFCITSAATFWEDGDSVQEAVAIIKQATNLILRLVNDVLDMSRLQAGKIRFEDRPFVLKELLGHIGAATALQLKEKPDVEFREKVTNDTPQFICGDSARISQILSNLVSNAVKYTDQGRVELLVSTVDYKEAVKDGLVKENEDDYRKSRSLDPEDESLEDADPSPSSNSDALEHHSLIRLEEGRRRFDGPRGLSVLRIDVIDTGVGIPGRRIDQIFQPYTQVRIFSRGGMRCDRIMLELLTKRFAFSAHI